jgi:hypothetical protein
MNGAREQIEVLVLHLVEGLAAILHRQIDALLGASEPPSADRHVRRGATRAARKARNRRGAGAPSAPRRAATARTKYCSSCDHVKPRSAFGKHTRKPDGLQTVCKACALEMGRAARAAKAARQGGRKAQGKTGGAPPPTTTAAGSRRTRAPEAVEAGLARSGARPADAEKGGPPAPRRSASGRRGRKERAARLREAHARLEGAAECLRCRTCGAVVFGRDASRHLVESHNRILPAEEALSDRYFERERERERQTRGLCRMTTRLSAACRRGIERSVSCPSP